MKPRWAACLLVACGGPSAPAAVAGEQVVLPSYEEAVAAAESEKDVGPRGAPELTDEELLAPMQNASWVSACGVPSSAKVTVRVVIRHGAAVGLSLHADPRNEPQERCMKDHVAKLRWPDNPRTDSFTTTY